ncbi:MAG: ABC transporter permease [bacterium]
MRTILYLIQKEFRQIIRNKFMIRLILIAPIMQTLVLGHALNTDLKNVNLAIVDLDHSKASRELASSFFASSLFRPAKMSATPSNVEEVMVHHGADMVLWIPEHYERDIATGRSATVGIYVDGTNSSLAGLSGGYASAILRKQNEAIRRERLDANPRMAAGVYEVKPISRFIYNPELETRYYMIPGVVVLIVTIISGMLSGMAVVREKEIGTLEQLLVTPITPLQLIAGKTIPFAIISFIDIGLVTLFGILYFRLPFAGSVLLLAGAALLYLLVTLGVGLLASTVSQTQQQSMFTVWFIMIFAILTSGFFFAIENMPTPVRALTLLNPLRYFLSIVRGVFLKNVSLMDAMPDLLPLALIGVVVFGVAVTRFRKRVA